MKFVERFVATLFLALVGSAFADGVKIDVEAARAGKGILVLQTGSDWCVSGEQVRKVFESSEFRHAVGSKYLLAVYDEMEEPTETVKESNALLSDILIRTKRFPAITCYGPGTRPKVFAQIENVPGGITAVKLAELVAKLSARRIQAETLFKKAASQKGEKAADLYGAAFDLLVPMMGTFHRNELFKGKCAWSDEWKALSAHDKDDSLGWLKHFEIDDYKGVTMVESGDEKTQILSCNIIIKN